jgi:hypothetical protein
MNDILSQLKGIALSDEDSESEVNSAPIVRYIDLVLEQAMREQASDIHFEPLEREFKIRYRVDGALYEMSPPPAHLANTIISRIKVISNLNIAERRVPQDGRMVMSLEDRDIDFRVSTLPTSYGESVVLRVLDRSSVSLDLDNLGMPTDISEYIEGTIIKPNGIFICTGPTGAGKTTTLYACLRKINTIDSKLLTAEDPVEYDVEGIIQVPVNDGIGLTFSRILRAFYAIVNRNLNNSFHIVLHGILSSEKFTIDGIYFSQACIECGGLSGTGRASANENAVRLNYCSFNVFRYICWHPQVIKVKTNRRTIQNTQNNTLSITRRQGRNAEIYVPVLERHYHPSVLRYSPFGNIKIRYYLDSRNDGIRKMGRRRRHLIKSSIHTVTNFKFPLERLKMNI